MKRIILIAHNIRSAHNIGSLIRTAEGLNLSQFILSGYSPYLRVTNDRRLEHEIRKVESKIIKTSLGAEKSLNIKRVEDLDEYVRDLKKSGYKVLALEQTDDSIDLTNYKLKGNIAIIVGNEIDGIDDEALKLCDITAEIPMLGQKESFNVVQAAAMALFYLRFMI